MNFPHRTLGRVLLRKGEFVQAEPYLREAVEIDRESPRAKRGRYIEWAEKQSLLGECLTRLGQYSQAESLLVGSLPTIEKCRGEKYAERQKAIDRIIALYEAWGRPDKAAAYRTGS